MADTENKVDSTIGGLANLSNAPDDALVVLEYLGKAYNSTMAQLKAALGTITGFAKTAGDSTPGTNDVYTITFGNGGKLDITIPIPTNGKNGYTPQKGVDYNDGYTPRKGVDYNDGHTPQKGVDYNDGFSPTVDIKQLQDGVEITITDATGPHTATLKNPKDGVSPSFRVDEIEGGYRVYLSSAHEHQQFDLLNGESGDWNVNNPTWKGFIKGRTHSKEEYGVDGVVIEETSVAFSGTTQYQMISGIMSEAIQVGGKYTVTYNGVDYACIGKYYDGAYIGNGSFMNVGGGNEEDTGEPFCIQLFGGDFYMLWKADKTKETVTVKVVGEKVVIWHKLDKGYLPDDIGYVPRQTVTWDGDTEGLVEVSFDGNNKFYKVSDLTPAKEELLKFVIEEYNSENGVTRYLNEPAHTEDFESGNRYAIFISEDASVAEGHAPLAVVVLENSDEMSAEPGIYFYYYGDTVHVNMTKSISWGAPKKIDFGCMPVGYPSLSVVKTVLPETAFEFSEGGAMLPAITLEPGKHYLVNYLGFEYLCKASVFNMEGMTVGVVLGNEMMFADGNDTGELFALISIDPSMSEALGGAQTMLMPVGNINFTSGTISIQKVEPEAMNPAFLPKMVVNFTKVNDDAHRNGVCDVTLQEIVEAFEAGRMIEGRLSYMGSTVILPLVMLAKPYSANGSSSSGTYIFACGGATHQFEVIWAGTDDGQEAVTIKGVINAD